MRIQDRILRALNDERAVNKILMEFGISWFVAGIIFGVFIEFILRLIN